MDLSHALRAVFTGVPHIFLGGEPSVRAGSERLAAVRLGARRLPDMRILSRAFAQGGAIPVRHTADGEGLAPPLLWEGLPEGTESLVLLVEDPDAPTPRPFVHWLAILPPQVPNLGVDAHQDELFVRKGFTSMLSTDWVGCAPPRGDLEHHYHFQLFALDHELSLNQPLGRSALLRQMQGHVLGFTELIGTYQRPESH